MGRCYRAHNPVWSAKPLSGDGAAIRGARFNPKGLPALYLALSIEGAVIEAAQGFGHKLQPLTLCMYEVDCEDIVDLATEAGRTAQGVSLDEIGCAWALALADGRRPASWSVAERLIAAGAAGVLTPSFARGARPDMTNLVLWKWGPDRPYKVDVYDPSDRLPKDQTSWT